LRALPLLRLGFGWMSITQPTYIGGSTHASLDIVRRQMI